MDHWHKVFMVSGNQHNMSWPEYFPRGIKGLTSAAECDCSASDGGSDRKLLLQPHRACQGERKKKIPATEGTQPSLVSCGGC